MLTIVCKLINLSSLEFTALMPMQIIAQCSGWRVHLVFLPLDGARVTLPPDRVGWP